MKTSVILDILALAMLYGIPAVRDIIRTWEKDEVTPEDIRALATLIKRPDDYDAPRS